MRKFLAVTIASGLALAGFAAAAGASATVDLIWIDVSETNLMGNPVCLLPANRNCPPDPRSTDSGVTISGVRVPDNITLGVILTAGPNGSIGAGVSVNYGDAQLTLGVVGFRNLTTPPYLTHEIWGAYHLPPYIDDINSTAAPPLGDGIGLPPGVSAYLGTVTFHEEFSVNGTFEITVGTDGPRGVDGVLDSTGNHISDTTTFNSAFLINAEVGGPTPTPTATPTPMTPRPPGSVVGWGSDAFGESTSPDAVNGVAGTAIQVAAGLQHSCAIQAGTGNAVCWGRDDFGQASPPDSVNGVLGTATQIAAGQLYSCAIQASTGKVVCWGDLRTGKPPDGVNGVSGTATDIATNTAHSCAIQSDTGSVICWGSDSQGQSTPPDDVNGVLGTAIDIAVGEEHSCAIQAGTGKVVCWGADWQGQATPPNTVNGVWGTATQVAAGGLHSCAIQTATGSIGCWGDDTEGQATPPIAAGSAIQITAGFAHSCAIQSGTHNAICWGSDSQGQATPPESVNGVSGIAADVAAGIEHTLAIVGGLEPTPTPTATPEPRCEDLWPVDSIVTIAKGQSQANNLKVSHLISGNIVDPDALCPASGPCTAHRIPVCAGTQVSVAVRGSIENRNVGKGVISCDAAGCSVDAIEVTEKYRSVSADGKDTDRITLLPR